MGAREVQCDSVSDRLVQLYGGITPVAAESVVARILRLYAKDSRQHIFLRLDSAGGDVKAGMAIYETMQLTGWRVATCCVRVAGSMAALLLAAGAPGKRAAVAGARIVLHEPWAVAPGWDMRRQVEETIRLKVTLYELWCKHTGRSAREIRSDVERGLTMTADQALAYGLIDRIGAFQCSEEW